MRLTPSPSSVRLTIFSSRLPGSSKLLFNRNGVTSFSITAILTTTLLIIIIIIMKTIIKIIIIINKNIKYNNNNNNNNNK